MESRIPSPNRGLMEVLMSQKMRMTMLMVASEATVLFKAMAPKRTGRMAASAKPSVRLSDKTTRVNTKWGNHDRWMGVVSVDAVDPFNKAPYPVWNMSGAGPGKHPRSTGRRPKFGPFEGSYTFNKVTKAMRGANAVS